MATVSVPPIFAPSGTIPASLGLTTFPKLELEPELDGVPLVGEAPDVAVVAAGEPVDDAGCVLAAVDCDALVLALALVAVLSEFPPPQAASSAAAGVASASEPPMRSSVRREIEPYCRTEVFGSMVNIPPQEKQPRSLVDVPVG
jgi:hypothetical protein